MSDWPQVGRDAQRTGFSPDTLNNAGGTTPVDVSWRKVFTPEARLHPQAQAIAVTTGGTARLFIGTCGIEGNASKLYALSTTGSSTASGWSGPRTVDAPILRGACSDGTRVTWVTQKGTVYCVLCADGADVWSPSTVALPGQCQAAPLYADGLFIYVDSSGQVTALQPTTGTVGSAGWTYQISVTTGGHDFGIPLMMTPAFYDGGSSATRWVIVPRLDGYIEAVYTSGVNKGTQAWITSTALPYVACFKDYWPVVTGTRLLIRSLPKLGLLDSSAWLNTTPSNRDLQPGTYAAQGAKLLDARTTNPTEYQHSLFDLDVTDGSWSASDAVIHWMVAINMHGPNPPVAIDEDGNALIPAMVDGGSAGGWAALNLSTGEVGGFFYDPTGGENNNDETVAASCANRDHIVVHRQGYGQAQFHGIHNLDTDDIRHLSDGPSSPKLVGNMEHGLTNPATVFGTRLYQNAVHQLICWAT